MGKASDFLRPHQIDAIEKIHSLNGNSGVFTSVGSGKTRIALVYARYRKIDRLVVVQPGYTTDGWVEESQKIGWEHPIYNLTNGSIKDRAEKLKRTGPGLVQVNYEAYWQEPLRTQIGRWARGIVFDEAQRLRGRGTKQSRYAGTMPNKDSIEMRLALTATPGTDGLEGVWAMYRFIDPTVFGTWTDFQRRYLIMGGFQFPQIIGYANQEEAYAKIDATSFQWQGTLPDAPDIRIPVRLGSVARAIYEKMKKSSIVELTSLDGQSGVAIGKLALEQRLRLHQIGCGFVGTDDHQILPIGTEKADQTMELLGDLLAQKQKVVVFCQWLHDLDLLESKISDKKWRYARISGSVPVPERLEIRKAFDRGEFDVLIMQTRSGNQGIDLGAASAGIFYSVNSSLDQMVQGKGRMTGELRQRHEVTFYHMVCENTVDEDIYKDLTTKVSDSQKITSLSYALKFIGAQ